MSTSNQTYKELAIPYFKESFDECGFALLNAIHSFAESRKIGSRSFQECITKLELHDEGNSVQV